MMYFLFVLFLSAAGFVSCDARVNRSDSSDIGNWTVGDCLKAEFAMHLTIHLSNSTAANATQVVKVPTTAKADTDDKNCKNESQILSLSWSSVAKNDSTVNLKRKLQITFQKEVNTTMYGVHNIYAYIEAAKFAGENKSTEISWFEINWDAENSNKLMFETPLDRSFLCNNVGTVQMSTALRYNNSLHPQPIKLDKTQLNAEKVIFDAFRPAGKVPDDYRTPMDCDYKPNDIIPIAVGIALATLVVAVLVAYMVGRRRHMQRGYQSV